MPLIIGLYSAAGWKDPALAAQYAVDDHARLLLHAAGLLLRRVRAGRPGAQRPRPVRADDVGPDRQQRGLHRGAADLRDRLRPDDTGAPFTSGQALLLGVGSTLGIAVQAAVLLPFLRAAATASGRASTSEHTGLGKTFRLAKWTLGFVLVTQIALVVVNKLASSATVGGKGAGLTAYSNAYAVWILPHSLITVSLATAMLPGSVPARSRWRPARRGLGDHARHPVGGDRAAAGRGCLLGARDAAGASGVRLRPRRQGCLLRRRGAMALAIGLVPFTVQYICLRAFYALEDNRTTFFLQCLIAGANVALGVAPSCCLTVPRSLRPAWLSPTRWRT